MIKTMFLISLCFFSVFCQVGDFDSTSKVFEIVISDTASDYSIKTKVDKPKLSDKQILCNLGSFHITSGCIGYIAGTAELITCIVMIANRSPAGYYLPVLSASAIQITMASWEISVGISLKRN